MNLKMMKSNRKINEKFINTWETLDDIKLQYVDSDSNLSDENELIIKYINSLDEFSKTVFYLYCEYGSYRAVADETNRAKDVIGQIINEIREDIKNNKHIINKEND